MVAIFLTKFISGKSVMIYQKNGRAKINMKNVYRKFFPNISHVSVYVLITVVNIFHINLPISNSTLSTVNSIGIKIETSERFCNLKRHMRVKWEHASFACVFVAIYGILKQVHVLLNVFWLLSYKFLLPMLIVFVNCYKCFKCMRIRY